jgi:hypothetical protein
VLRSAFRRATPEARRTKASGIKFMTLIQPWLSLTVRETTVCASRIAAAISGHE